eukprot:scaffold116947_cov63-Phaeocystis_antarctica.AAC.2
MAPRMPYSVKPPSKIQTVASLVHGRSRCGVRKDAKQMEFLEHWQSTAVERGGEGGAAGVGDLGVVEEEPLELRQHSSWC